MRLIHKLAAGLQAALNKDFWLSIWKPHKYYGMGDREFCVLCEHSKKWHLENRNWCEPKEK